MNAHTKEEIKASYKKKGMMFFIIAAGVLVLFVLFSILFFAGVVKLDPEEGEEMTLTGMGIAMLVVGGLGAIGLSIVGFINMSKTKEPKLTQYYEQYLKNYEQQVANAAKREEHRLNELAKVSPDFDVTKTINMSEHQRLWINAEKKQVQFLITANTANELASASKVKWTKVYKTHVFNIDDITYVDINHSVQTQTHYSSSGYRSSSAIEGGANFSSGTATEQQIHHWEVEIKTTDIDFPSIVISFGQDGTTATLVLETLKLLQNK